MPREERRLLPMFLRTKQEISPRNQATASVRLAMMVLANQRTWGPKQGGEAGMTQARSNMGTGNFLTNTPARKTLLLWPPPAPGSRWTSRCILGGPEPTASSHPRHRSQKVPGSFWWSWQEGTQETRTRRYGCRIEAKEATTRSRGLCALWFQTTSSTG